MAAAFLTEAPPNLKIRTMQTFYFTILAYFRTSKVEETNSISV